MTESVSQSVEVSGSLPEVHSSEKLPWYDRLSDFFNAILVKETRQSLKSRQFVSTFFLLLGVSWVISVFLLLSKEKDLEFSSLGHQFFMSFYVVLAFTVLLVVPFNAFRSLLNERDQETYDLLSITALTPRQIVWGKLLSALIQIFIYYSAITPFIAFCSLLQGFDTISAAYILVMTFLVSLFYSMIGLTISSFGKTRAIRTFLTLSVLLALSIQFYAYISLIVQFGAPSISSLASTPEFWWGTLCVVGVGVTFFFLFQQITINQLTFESANRSSGIRLICSIQFWLLWAGFLGFHYWQGIAPDRSSFMIVVIMSIVQLAVLGLFVTTEGDHLSHRVRRSKPRRFVWRLLRLPFMPGGSLGYFFMLLHFLTMGVFITVAHFQAIDTGTSPFTIAYTGNSVTGWSFLVDLLDLQSRSWTPELRVVAASLFYLVIFCGFGTFLSRWGSSVSVDLNTNVARVLTVIFFTVGIILPMMIDSFRTGSRRVYELYHITSLPHTLEYLANSSPWRQPVALDFSKPVESLNKLAGRGFSEIILVILFVVAALAILVNLRAMILAVRQVLSPPPSSKETANPAQKTPIA